MNVKYKDVNLKNSKFDEFHLTFSTKYVLYNQK